MQFSSKEDIESPIEEVFSSLSEFEMFERSAIRRGVEVTRIQEFPAPQVGQAWSARFLMRGKLRDVNLELVEYNKPQFMRIEAVSKGLEGAMTLELLSLSQRRTRMAVILNLKPKTLSSRLFIQSLKLAKANLNKRFKLKVAEYAKMLEERHQRLA